MTHLATPDGAISPANAELTAVIGHEPLRLSAVTLRPIGVLAVVESRVVVLLMPPMGSEEVTES
jgi:hypothetical protein